MPYASLFNWGGALISLLVLLGFAVSNFIRFIDRTNQDRKLYVTFASLLAWGCIWAAKTICTGAAF